MSPTILIVDDDSDSRELLTELLSRHGYRTVVAENGRDGLERLEALGSVCLILLDLMMPVMSGWEFRAAQLENERFSRFPVVILTADVRAREKIDKLQPAGFLPKPIRFSALLELVARHCGRMGASTQSA